jgi:tetratricopeptide (TPR) repeat protein
MKNQPSEDPGPLEDSGQRSRLPWLLAAGCLLAILVGLLSLLQNLGPTAPPVSDDKPSSAPADNADTSTGERLIARTAKPRSAIESGPTAEEIVTNKVAQFVRSRRKLARAMAEHFKKPFPGEFEKFFDAAEAGRYEEMKAIYKSLREQRENGSGNPDYGPGWRTIIETEGAVREAHDWPAQKLLDYGNSVLDSLRPGMIYAGGTDPGCFIPTLLNETSEGQRPIVLTQNALADGSYLDYLNFLYGDRIKTPTQEESKRAFQDYLDDAQKRLQHDQQFPNEPRQLRPGEDVSVIEGRVNVSGQIAVMAINEKLFQTFMQNNPGVSFAMEESFPFASTYANATTLGPIMEMGVQDGQSSLTAERAAQSVDYWRGTAQQLLSDPATPEESHARKAYSKLVSSQAGLLLNRGYTAEAEQAFQIANEICPTSPEAVFRYINLLVEQGRLQDAVQVGEGAFNAAPDNQQFGNLLRELKKMKGK